MTTKHKLVYEGKYFRVFHETVDLGRETPETFEYVWRTDGARIVATDDSRILLTREFRHELDEVDWRLPGGKVDPPESPEVAAQRELREETGYVARSWEFLWSTTPDSTVRYLRHFYVASDLTFVGTSHDLGEHIENRWVDVDDACNLALGGQVREEISALAILRLRHIWEGTHQ
jgi:ADP-ribose pyrophosphatase